MDTSTPESRRTTATSSESNPSSVPSVPLAHRPVRVVGQRHDAGAGAQGEAPRRGVQVPRPFAAPHGVDADLRAGEPRHHGSVDLVDAPVGGGKHGSGCRVWGVHAAVEQGERVVGGMAGAEGVQRAGERGVGLAVDAPQLREVHRERAAARDDGGEDAGLEEPWPLPWLPGEQRPVVVGDDGRQLGGVPDHVDADASERGPAPPRALEELVEAVDEVGAGHGGLVDDDVVQCPVERVAGQGGALGPGVPGRHAGLGVDEAVDGLAAVDVGGGHAGGGEHDGVRRGRGAPPVVDEGRFARAGPAGQEAHARGLVQHGKGTSVVFVFHAFASCVRAG